ncbi:hypothetical protein JW998_08980 [candidate division KSB1 bacterium]|nr:hypothetical protein [candidate division KSB1 bacterium]
MQDAAGQMKIVLAISLLCFFPAGLSGQEAAADLTSLQQAFQSFDYDSVIDLAAQALRQPQRFTPEQLISIHEMKAVSHYAKAEMSQARDSFVAILKIDSLYAPDPVKTSPKIIAFFNSLKQESEYRTTEHQQPPPEKIVIHDTVMVVQQTLGAYKMSVPVSLVFPGAGHLLMGETGRGAVLLALSTATLATAIYYSYESRQKEDDYMNALDDAAIRSTYNAYNSAYRTRNALWAAYAAVWIFSQTDLLLFHERRQNITLSLAPSCSELSPMLSFTVQF